MTPDFYREEIDGFSFGRRKLNHCVPKARNSSLWVGLASVAVGAATSIYGANQAKKASDAANQANLNQNSTNNQIGWSNYLMSRGLAPSNAAPGQLPSQMTAINTRLPLWASVTSNPGGKRTFTKVGSNQPANYGKVTTGFNRLATPGELTASMPAPPPPPAAGPSSSGDNGRPLWLRPLDPIGLFG